MCVSVSVSVCLCVLVFVCIYLSVCGSATQENYSHKMKSKKLIKQVLLLFSFCVWPLLSILLMGGGLSNEAHHELLPKNTKVMLHLPLISQ